MAAGRLPAPGTDFGPCPEPPGCQHTDCSATRADAAASCHLCGKPIGYDVRFYVESDTRQLVHAACLEDTINA